MSYCPYAHNLMLNLPCTCDHPPIPPKSKLLLDVLPNLPGTHVSLPSAVRPKFWSLLPSPPNLPDMHFVVRNRFRAQGTRSCLHFLASSTPKLTPNLPGMQVWPCLCGALPSQPYTTFISSPVAVKRPSPYHLASIEIFLTRHEMCCREKNTSV